MVRFFGIKFRNSMKIHYAHPQGELHYGDKVIADGPRGVACGTVVLTPMELPDDKAPSPIREMRRLADAADLEREENNIRREKEAYRICKEKIAQRGLDMKLIRAECPFDDARILFYFTADGRIDFRELVKDLAGVFRTRIELRQVGVRDETKLLGGMGICGRPLCCHSYLNDFVPVSIKMAKEQNLSLNPAKISGNCGRLMCCLKNEADTYTYLSKGLPSKGNQMTAPDGMPGEVVSVDILRQRVRCVVDIGNDERESRDYHISEITFEPNSKRPKTPNVPKVEKKKSEPQAEEAKRPVRGRVIDDGIDEEPVSTLSLEEEFLAVASEIPTPMQNNSKKAANARQKGGDHRPKNSDGKKNAGAAAAGRDKGFSKNENGGHKGGYDSKGQYRPSDGGRKPQGGKGKNPKQKEQKREKNIRFDPDDEYGEGRQYRPRKGPKG